MPFDHNDHYHRLLLRHLPSGGRTTLDAGCGTDRFARRLAGRGYEVDALDPSPQVVAAAESIGGGPRYRRADVTTTDLPRGHYDVTTCLASLHHMPFATVTRLREALAPGGVLLVLGCYAGITRWDLMAVPANAVARAAVHVSERLRGAAPPPLQAPVRQPDMSLTDIRTEATRLLPGSQVRQLLFWRYLLTYNAWRVTAVRPTASRPPARRRRHGWGRTEPGAPAS
ncbi:class I SAM-dependent methyltransferase [Streptomyces sp. NPDC005349]|uniref:class I SAM-dependent methyltransferase n=1 Tax=Streptomyces sp. NPDC005349 TaxID=3157037 RepID=UPI0033A18398